MTTRAVSAVTLCVLAVLCCNQPFFFHAASAAPAAAAVKIRDGNDAKSDSGADVGVRRHHVIMHIDRISHSDDSDDDEEEARGNNDGVFSSTGFWTHVFKPLSAESFLEDMLRTLREGQLRLERANFLGGAHRFPSRSYGVDGSSRTYALHLDCSNSRFRDADNYARGKALFALACACLHRPRPEEEECWKGVLRAVTLSREEEQGDRVRKCERHGDHETKVRCIRELALRALYNSQGERTRSDGYNSAGGAVVIVVGIVLGFVGAMAFALYGKTRRRRIGAQIAREDEEFGKQTLSFVLSQTSVNAPERTERAQRNCLVHASRKVV